VTVDELIDFLLDQPGDAKVFMDDRGFPSYVYKDSDGDVVIQ